MAAILGIVFIDKIIWGLGASRVLFPYCKDYLLIILIFTPASMLQVLFQNLIVTAGKPVLGLVLTISAGIINIILDYFFLVHLNMGVMGAALGTGIGYVIPTITGILFFFSKSSILSFKKPIIDIPVLIESCANGSSEMVSQISTASFLFSGINIFSSASFTALSNGKISALISFLRIFGFIMIGLLVLPHFIKVIGIWAVVPLAEILTCLVSVFLIIQNKDKYHYI